MKLDNLGACDTIGHQTVMRVLPQQAGTSHLATQRKENGRVFLVVYVGWKLKVGEKCTL
jgi:hypothetical protein